MSALMARDSHRARSVVDRALRTGAEPGALMCEVLSPALREFGELWEAGKVTVADEHYATGITEGVMAVIASKLRKPPAGGRLAIVACPPGERHGLAARILGDFLEGDAWEVIVLGPDVPARDLLALVADEQPDLVCLSVTMPALIEPTFEVLGALGTADPRPLIAIGGQAWDGSAQLAKAMGADFIAADPYALLEWARRTLPPLPEED